MAVRVICSRLVFMFSEVGIYVCKGAIFDLPFKILGCSVWFVARGSPLYPLSGLCPDTLLKGAALQRTPKMRRHCAPLAFLGTPNPVRWGPKMSSASLRDTFFIPKCFRFTLFRFSISGALIWFTSSSVLYKFFYGLRHNLD